MFKKLISALLVSGIAIAAQAQVAVYQEGTHYERISPAQPNGGDQVEVIEFFSYGCPHCYTFEPHLSKWKKSKPANVKLTLLPAVFNDAFVPLGQAHFALESMGVMDKLHAPLFEAIHKKKQPVNTIEQIADIVAEKGVDRAKFIAIAGSFPVDNAVRRTMQTYGQYRISGVPAVAVNGQYMVTGQLAGSYPEMVNIIAYLVEQENMKLKPKKAAQKTSAAKQK